MTDLEKLKKSFKSPIFDREKHSCFPHGRSSIFMKAEICDYLPISFLLKVIEEIEKDTWSKEWYND